MNKSFDEYFAILNSYKELIYYMLSICNLYNDGIIDINFSNLIKYLLDELENLNDFMKDMNYE